MKNDFRHSINHRKNETIYQIVDCREIQQYQLSGSQKKWFDITFSSSVQIVVLIAPTLCSIYPILFWITRLKLSISLLSLTLFKFFNYTNFVLKIIYIQWIIINKYLTIQFQNRTCNQYVLILTDFLLKTWKIILCSTEKKQQQ